MYAGVLSLSEHACSMYYSGVAKARSLVGHKCGKWSLVVLSLTTPHINTAEYQSLAHSLDYFCSILIELKG